MKTKKSNIKNQSGITLVALVVTIIILIILATISIRMVIGEGGLIWQANNAKVEYRAAEVDEEVLAWKAEKQMAKYTDGITPQGRDALIEDQLKRGLLTQEEADTATKTGEVKIGSRTIHYGEDETPTDPSDDQPKIPTTVKEAKESQYKFDDTTTLKDEKANNVVIPGKFHVATDSGISVQEGVVIEDEVGNQFVWIPVSNTDGDNNKTENEENLITKDNGETVEITLGRYTFKREKNEETQVYEDGTPTLVQKGSEYADNSNSKYKIGDYQELETFREASGSGSSKNDVNATAKDLQGFVESVQKNHGYYIGRYEASKGSGSAFGVGADQSFYKPLVQKSKTVWTPITQGNASKVCRNMYNSEDEESTYVESDLINSYMWDTAIVYIQAMENSNYANQKPLSTSLKNTGETGDEKCHIFDMAGNLSEWSTEYSTFATSSTTYPCVDRGGYYITSIRCAPYRNSSTVTGSNTVSGFRPGLYIKGNPES